MHKNFSWFQICSEGPWPVADLTVPRRVVKKSSWEGKADCW